MAKKKPEEGDVKYCPTCEEDTIFDEGRCLGCGRSEANSAIANLVAAAREMCERKNSKALEKLRLALDEIDRVGTRGDAADPESAEG